MLRVGLTGGIGAGKSSVARRLIEKGASLADGDVLAREVLEPGTEGLAAVAKEFGDGVIAPDGSLDRAALASIVFSDDDARARLEGITHPRIARRAAEILEAAGSGGVGVYDMPLLVEKNAAAQFHLTIVVMVDAELRLQRLVEHRGFTEEDARSRIAAQVGDEQRRAAADVVLRNDGSTEDLVAAVDELWERRLLPFATHLRERTLPEGPGTVALTSHDPGWAAVGTRLADRVRRAVAGSALPGADRFDVQHVGSTAVPGLDSKDVIDLQLVVPDLAAADRLEDPLASAGFPRREEDWWDLTPEGGTVAKRLHGSADPGRRVNLHVRSEGWMARMQPLFRDWLRAHPGEAKSYERVKHASTGVGVDAYNDAKGPWIEDACRRAQAWDDAGRPGG